MSQLVLAKGEVVDLTKEAPGVSLFKVGVGWNPNSDPAIAAKVDIDVVAILSNSDGKGAGASDVFYFRNIDGTGKVGDQYYAGKSTEEVMEMAKSLAQTSAVAITKDNKDGEGEGDDETLFVNSDNIPEGKKVTVAINLYEAVQRGLRFGVVSGAYLNVYDTSGAVILTYELNEDYSRLTGVIVGEFYAKNGSDKFKALGIGFDGDLNDLLTKFQ